MLAYLFTSSQHMQVNVGLLVIDIRGVQCIYDLQLGMPDDGVPLLRLLYDGGNA